MELSPIAADHIRNAANSLRAAAARIEKDDAEACDVICNVLDDMRQDLEQML